MRHFCSSKPCGQPGVCVCVCGCQGSDGEREIRPPLPLIVAGDEKWEEATGAGAEPDYLHAYTAWLIKT